MCSKKLNESIHHINLHTFCLLYSFVIKFVFFCYAVHTSVEWLICNFHLVFSATIYYTHTLFHSRSLGWWRNCALAHKVHNTYQFHTHHERIKEKKKIKWPMRKRENSFVSFFRSSLYLSLSVCCAYIITISLHLSLIHRHCCVRTCAIRCPIFVCI